MFSYCNGNPVIRVDSTGDIYRACKADLAGYGGGIVFVPILDWFINTCEDIKESLTGNISFAKKKAKNKKKGEDQPQTPDVKYPGNDPGQSPGDDYEWRGKEPVGGDKGAWINKNTGEQWHPDLNHQPPKGPHWDYTDVLGFVWSVFEDGRIIIW